MKADSTPSEHAVVSLISILSMGRKRDHRTTQSPLIHFISHFFASGSEQHFEAPYAVRRESAVDVLPVTYSGSPASIVEV